MKLQYWVIIYTLIGTFIKGFEDAIIKLKFSTLQLSNRRSGERAQEGGVPPPFSNNLVANQGPSERKLASYLNSMTTNGILFLPVASFGFLVPVVLLLMPLP